MSLQKIIGLVLFAAAVILLILGITSAQSIGDRLSAAFTGQVSSATLWYFIGAGAAAVAGLVLFFGRFRRR